MLIKDGDGDHTRNRQGPIHVGIFGAAVVRGPAQAVTLHELLVRLCVCALGGQPLLGVAHPGHAGNGRYQLAEHTRRSVGSSPVTFGFDRHFNVCRVRRQHRVCRGDIAVDLARAVRQRADNASGPDRHVASVFQVAEKANQTERLGCLTPGKSHTLGVHVGPVTRGIIGNRLL